MIFKDYYKILGLPNSNVTTEQIKQAYREQAKKYHPDINTTSNFSEERFKDINEAYKTLSNSSTRRKYDRMWNSRIGKKQKNKQQNKKLKRYVYKKHRFLFPYVIFNKICRFIFQKKLTKSGKLQLKFFKIPISIKLLSIEGTPKER